MLVVAVPLPLPTPVAVNTTPTVLLDAPIRVKSVVPTVNIVYSVPATNEPELTVEPAVDVNTLLLVPGLIDEIALVAFPTKIEFGVLVVAPVPPLATLKVPVTFCVKLQYVISTAVPVSATLVISVAVCAYVNVVAPTVAIKNVPFKLVLVTAAIVT